MSERTVNWLALADFSRVRSEALKTKAALKSLKDETNDLNDSNDRLSRSERNVSENASRANRDLAHSTDEVAKAKDNLAQSSHRLSAAVDDEALAQAKSRLEAAKSNEARDKEAVAAKKVEAAERRLAEARTEEESATRSLRSYQGALTKARNAENSSLEKIRAANDKVTEARDRQIGATTELHDAEDNLAKTSQRLSSVQAQNAVQAQKAIHDEITARRKEAAAVQAEANREIEANKKALKAEQDKQAKLIADREKIAAADKKAADRNRDDFNKSLTRNQKLLDSYQRLVAARQAAENTSRLGTPQFASAGDTVPGLNNINREIASRQARGKVTSAGDVAAVNSLSRAEAALKTARDNLVTTTGRMNNAEQNLNVARAVGASTAARAAAAEDNVIRSMRDYGPQSAQAAQATETHTRSLVDNERAQNDVRNATNARASAANAMVQADDRVRGAETRLTNAVRSAERQFLGSSGSNRFVQNLGKVENAADKVDSKLGKMWHGLRSIFWPIVAGGAYILVQALSALVSGLFAVASAVGPAIGALAAIGPIAFAAASAVGVLGAAFAGIGGTLKAYQQEQLKGASQGTKAANTAANNADQVRSAEESLKNARQDVGTTARSVAQQVADAAHSVVQSQQQELDAQKALNQARIDAKKNIEDLKTAVIDAALAERGATLDLADARDNLQKVLNDPTATRADRERAQLQVDAAKQSAIEAKKTNDEAKKSSRQASSLGVNRNKDVIDARRQLAAATYDAAKAERDYRSAVQDGQRQNAKAMQAVSDAQRALAKAERNAGAAAGGAGSAAQNYQDRLNALTPAARKFVEKLISMKHYWTDLKNTAANNLFPGLDKSLNLLPKLFPVINKGFGGVAKVLGNFALNFTKMITNDTWISSFKKLFAAAQPILRNLGKGIMSLADAARAVTIAAIPMTKALMRDFVAWSDHLDDMATAPGAYRTMVRWFARSRSALEQLGRILGNVFGTLKNLGGAASKSGQSLLDSIENITQRWDDWTGSMSGQNQLQDFFARVRANLKIIDHLLGVLGGGFLKLGGSDKFKPIINGFRDIWNAIKDAFGASGGDLTKSFVSLLHSIATTIREISKNTSGLSTFLNILGDMFKIFDRILGIPGVAPFLGQVFEAFAAYKALKLVGAITGIRKLADAFGYFKRNSRGMVAAAAQSEAAVARASTATGAPVAPVTRRGLFGRGLGAAPVAPTMPPPLLPAPRPVAPVMPRPLPVPRPVMPAPLPPAPRVTPPPLAPSQVVPAASPVRGPVPFPPMVPPLRGSPGAPLYSRPLWRAPRYYSPGLTRRYPLLPEGTGYGRAPLPPGMGGMPFLPYPMMPRGMRPGGMPLYQQMRGMAPAPPGGWGGPARGPGFWERQGNRVRSIPNRFRPSPNSRFAGMGGMAGMLAGMLGIFAGGAVEGGQAHGARHDVGQALTYGGYGALLGSMVGPEGAAIGGGLGAAYGGIKDTAIAKSTMNGLDFVFGKQVKAQSKNKVNPFVSSDVANGVWNTKGAGAFSADVVDANKLTAAFAKTLIQGGQNSKEYARQVAAAALANTHVASEAKKAGLTQKDMTNAVVGSNKQFGRVRDVLKQTDPLYKQDIKQLHAMRQSYRDGQVALKKFADTHGFALKQEIQTGSGADLLKGKMIRLAQAGDTAKSTADQFDQSLGRLSVSVNYNGRSLDANTSFGQKNIAVIRGSAAEALKNAQAVYKQTGSLSKANSVLKTNRQTLLDQAKALGLNRSKVSDLIGQLYKVPKNIHSKVEVDGKSIGRIAGELNALNSTTITVPVNIDGTVLRMTTKDSHGHVHTVLASLTAAGGQLPTKIKDMVPGYTPGRDPHKFVSDTGYQVHLSGGEGILTPETTRAIGGAKGIAAMNKAFTNRHIPSSGQAQSSMRTESHHAGGVVAGLNKKSGANAGMAALVTQAGLDYTKGPAAWRGTLGVALRKRLAGVTTGIDIKNTSAPPHAQLPLDPGGVHTKAIMSWVESTDPGTYREMWTKQPVKDSSMPNSAKRNPLLPILSYVGGPTTWKNHRHNEDLARWAHIAKADRKSDIAKRKKETPQEKLKDKLINYTVAAERKRHHALAKQLDAKDRKWNTELKILSGTVTQEKGRVSALRNLLGMTGGGRNQGLYGTDMEQPVDHAAAHALGIAHPADWEHPWAGKVTDAETALAQSERANELMKEWNKALKQIADWGFTDLLNFLIDQGEADGLGTAKSAASDKATARRLNKSIKAGKTKTGVNAEDQTMIYNIISKLSSGNPANPYGLRDISSFLNVPDYKVVDLFTKMTKELATVPTALTKKFKADVGLFQEGLFYAASGGMVPGDKGVKKDSRPAMLMPGEGVLSHVGMKAIGGEPALNRANVGLAPQHLAAGGLVLSPDVASLGIGAATMGSIGRANIARSSAKAAQPANVTIHTEINNPTGENSIYSMNKNLQKQAALNTVARAVGNG